MPKKKPRGVLSHVEQRVNRKISSNRIIVNNIFGSLSTLWTIMADKWPWDEKQYDDISWLCLSLTNLHMK